MNCPWCGSPVEIRGSSWECGWCGDSGRLKRTPVQQPVQITLTLSFVYHVDLPETWNDLKKALGQIAPKDTSLLQLLGKVLLHHISVGIQHAGALPDEKKAEELRTFLHNTADLNLGESAEEIMRDAKHGVLFCEEVALSETECGTFWAELFATRPVEDYYNRIEPDGLYELFSELSSAYAYFGAKAGEEWEEEREYRWALQEAYNTHWQNRVLLHPDVERAKRLLATGDFPKNEDICREILLAEYPEEVPHETAEDFDERSWEYILDDVFANDPEKGMEMWRRLLDIAGPTLKIDTKTAETLLVDWGWMGHPNEEQALQLLISLEDARFVSQLFESAYLCGLQRDVLEICRDCREEALARHCLDLALKNPCLEQGWEKRYTQVFAPSSKRTKLRVAPPAKPPVSTPAKPNGANYYQFCNVQFKENGATYAYLTGGISLKAGDFVVVPISDRNVEKLARVTDVFVCSTQDAPYPPEKAKFVLGKSERTAFPERPKPQYSVPKLATVQAPVERKNTAPPVQTAPPAKPQESAPAVQSSITLQPASQTPAEPEKTKRKLPWKWIVTAAAVAAFAIFALPPMIRETQRQMAELQAERAAEQEAERQRAEAAAQRKEKRRLEEEAAAQRRREEKQARIDALKNANLPYPGMPYNELTSTKLGRASKVTHEMRSGQVCYTYVWQIRVGDYLYPVFVVTTENKDVLTAEQRNLEYWSDMALKGTVYHKPESKPSTPSQKPNTGSTSGFGPGSTGLRDIYESGEDLYEDDPWSYEDEDEAWDEWYED